VKLLGIDIGTTHIKGAVFNPDGTVVSRASLPTPTRMSQTCAYYNPEELWRTTAEVIRDVTEDITDLAAIGVASMAETGVLLDRRTGDPRSDFLPWFNTCASDQAERLKRDYNAERFARSGIRASFKCSLAKLLYLSDRGADFRNGIWLSSADYIVYRLTGTFATDFSLAGRTYAFDLLNKVWDEAWLKSLGFSADLFPPVFQAGTPVGLANFEGLPAVPAAVAGHDHICAALAVGAITPGIVFDSMGTAETLVGTLNGIELDTNALNSGLSYGCHVAPDRYYWLGGISASGGSIEWLRGILDEQTLSYDHIQLLVESAGEAPTSILYFPYLSGSGVPRPEAAVRASFIGLSASHKREHLAKAVLEGTAYELETIRRMGEAMTGQVIDRVIAVGGGTRSRPWMQIKADVCNCHFDLHTLADATLLGAALTAGVGARCYAGVEEASQGVRAHYETVEPNLERHQRYRELYEQGYLVLQDPLRAYYLRREQ
jgi:sugar (pentulose or hexulose) kinase